MTPGDQPPAVEGTAVAGVAVPLRVGAVILALVIAFFAAAIIAGASDNVSRPTCYDVDHGKAQPSSNGDCFAGSARRADLGLGFAIVGGIAAAIALVLSIMLAATGRWGPFFLIACGAAVAFLLLEIAVIHLF